MSSISRIGLFGSYEPICVYVLYDNDFCTIWSVLNEIIPLMLIEYLPCTPSQKKKKRLHVLCLYCPAANSSRYFTSLSTFSKGTAL